MITYGTDYPDPFANVADVADVADVCVAGGAMVADEVYDFVGRYVAYPSEHAHVAHTLWILHTWLMDEWDSTPRIAFLSPEPGSGKSRALEVTAPLVPRPVHAVNVTPSYLFRKVSDDDGAPTILFDEIDTVFGSKSGGDNEDLRGMLNAGHRRGATAGRCVIVGNVVKTEELPSYAAVAMAGLNDVPDTLMARSVVVRMRRRAPNETVEPWRDRTCEPAAHAIADRIRDWASTARHHVVWPDMPPGIEDRNADVWEALIASADLVGGDWPDRARVAAVALVAAQGERPPSLSVLLLRDLRRIFTDSRANVMSSEEILHQLHSLVESPWADLRGKPLDARGLARYLNRYEVRPKTVRVGETTPKGYTLEDLHDPFTRYLSPLSAAPASATSATSDTTQETAR